MGNLKNTGPRQRKWTAGKRACSYTARPLPEPPDASSQPHSPITMLRVTSITLPFNQGGDNGSSQSCEL